jgi:hypothetical protein
MPNAPAWCMPTARAGRPSGWWWAFQLIEGGWLLALALVLLAGTVWLVRRSE